MLTGFIRPRTNEDVGPGRVSGDLTRANDDLSSAPARLERVSYIVELRLGTDVTRTPFPYALHEEFVAVRAWHLLYRFGVIVWPARRAIGTRALATAAGPCGAAGTSPTSRTGRAAAECPLSPVPGHGASEVLTGKTRPYSAIGPPSQIRRAPGPAGQNARGDGGWDHLNRGAGRWRFSKER